MSASPFVLYERSPSSPVVPLEPDFPSPPVLRPYPPNNLSRLSAPISPSSTTTALGESYDSDLTIVSETLRPRAHPQPGMSFSTTRTPSFTLGSSSSSRALPITEDSVATTQMSQHGLNVNAAPFKFFPIQRAPTSMDGSTTSPSRTLRPLPSVATSVQDQGMSLDPPEPLFYNHRTNANLPADTQRSTFSDYPDFSPSFAPTAPPTRPTPGLSAPTETERYRQIHPLPNNQDLPRLQAFERNASMTSGWMNELGTIGAGLGIPPAMTLSRQSSSSERVPSPRPASGQSHQSHQPHQHQQPNYPRHFPISHEARPPSPPVQPRLGFAPRGPVAIPSTPASARAADDPPPRSGLAELLFSYGLTGPHLENTASAATVSDHAAARARDTSSWAWNGTAGGYGHGMASLPPVPSVPPPRPSRSMISDLYHDRDREEFSPHRLGRRGREETEDRSNRPTLTPPNPTTAFGAIRPTSQAHRDRLARADAWRLNGSGATDPIVPAGQYTRPFFDTLTSATNVSSRQGRYALDDPRDLRSRVRRRLSISDTDSNVEGFDGRSGGSGGSEVGQVGQIGTWNRDVQDAIGRRVQGDLPHLPYSPGSAARRHREISGPYYRPRPAGGYAGQEEREREREGVRARDRERGQEPWYAPAPALDTQLRRTIPGYDTIPVDTIDSARQDPLAFAPHMQARYGAVGTGVYQDRIRVSSRGGRNLGGDEAAFGFDGPEYDMGEDDEGLDDDGMGDDGVLADDFGDMDAEDAREGPMDLFGEHLWGEAYRPNPMLLRGMENFESASDTLNRYANSHLPGSAPVNPALHPPRPALPAHMQHGMIPHVRFTPDMDLETMVRIARSIARGVGRWPGHCRKRAAETVVVCMPWGDMGGEGKGEEGDGNEGEEGRTEGDVREKAAKEEGEGDGRMERDLCCSVCHDEYEPESKISVTPCKHMYHKDCLDTWLQTPNTSSCPMCRRDLAVLACVTKMVPSKTREEALPIWLAL